MDSFIIYLFILATLFYLTQIFLDSRKTRILLERPRAYKEKLDKLIEDIDGKIEQLRGQYASELIKGTDEKETKKLNIPERIRGLKQLQKRAYEDFYSNSFTPEDLK